MIVMDGNETINWFKNNSVDIENIALNYELLLSKQIPIDSGKKNYLAKEIAAIFNENETLLYVNEYGIWHSCENMYLFDGYRKSIGIDKKIYEKPSHIIKSNENIELYCLLGMILYFCMGCVIMKTENTDEIIVISHNEYIDVYAKNDKKIVMDSIKNIMEKNNK
jgi:hypothetical protein